MNLTPEQLQTVHRLQTDFPFFAINCLKIEHKEGGGLVPLEFNDAQWYFYNFFMEQWRRTGMIRIIVVKGRQQGISTIIEAFIYWLLCVNPYMKASIISHEAKSTDTLFEKIETYDDNCPSFIKPRVIENNNRTMAWDNHSKCVVFTAGSKNTGRSQTAQIQHQSERGFFENPGDIDAGAGQIVGTVPNSMVFKESTGNGQNHFWRETMQAIKKDGHSLFEVVFIPWYWQQEYRLPVPPDFERTHDEQKLVSTYGKETVFMGRVYPGLSTDEQLQWRRVKIAEFETTYGNGERWFKQEYPNCLDEAFQASGESYFDSDKIQAARKSEFEDDHAPLVLGVDPGRDGDRTVIARRRGRQFFDLEVYKGGMTETRLAGILSNIIDRENVKCCMIDYGQGSGTVDILRERGYGHIVSGVWFGEEPDKVVYGNKRAEMMVRFHNWFMDGPCSLPDDDDMSADILSIQNPQPNSSGKIYFEDKADIRKRLKRSPDILDAMALTFARFIRADYSNTFSSYTKNTKRGSGLTTRARVMNNRQGSEDDMGFTKAPNQRRYYRG